MNLIEYLKERRRKNTPTINIESKKNTPAVFIGRITFCAVKINEINTRKERLRKKGKCIEFI